MKSKKGRGRVKFKREFVRLKEGEASFVTYIKKRIARNQHFVAVVHGGMGGSGTGKTWTAASIAHQLDPNFDESQVINSSQELMSLVNSGKLKRGSVILADEAQIWMSSRNWQSKISKLMNFLFSTCRHEGWIMLFTTPFSDFVDSSLRKMFHAQLECVAIDYNNKCVKVKPQLIQYYPKLSKFYYPRLIVQGKGRMAPLTFWSVPKPPPHIIVPIEHKTIEFKRGVAKDVEKVMENETRGKSDILREVITLSKPPTEFQERMIAAAKKGIIKTGEIAEELNAKSGKVSSNKKFLRNRGIFLEKIAKSAISRGKATSQVNTDS